MNDCSQTKMRLMLAADGELGSPESAWLEEHVRSCPACHAERMRFHELDQDLGTYGEMMSWRIEPGIAAPRGGVRPIIRWMPRFAVALVAMLLLGAVLVHRFPPAKSPEAPEESFVPIPYVQPLGEYESATVMRMEIPIAALIAAGYKVDASDPTAVVKADVLVGEDGRAHAVHVLSGLVLN
jgi:hypothetical protein